MKREEKTEEKAAALNIRNFPEDLRWLCRERADQRRISLREFVIETLRQAAQQQQTATP